MSFSLGKDVARACIASVEVSDTMGHANTSPILHGASSPGGAANSAKPAHETQMIGRLRHGIKTPITRTDTLTRKYAASGSNKS